MYYSLLKYIYFVLLGLPEIIAYDKNGIRLDMTFEVHESVTTINMLATNTSAAQVTDFLFQAAVPKVSDGYLMVIKLPYYRSSRSLDKLF